MSYLYSLSTNFNNNIELGQFSENILNSSLGNIFINAKLIGDVVTINFTQTLTAPQLTTLNNLISSYVVFNLESIDFLYFNNATGVDPTSNDDASKYYQVGSLWRNTPEEKMYMCIDNTTSNAVWQLIGGGISDIFSGVTTTGGVDISSGWTDIPLNLVYKQTSNISFTGAEVTINKAGSFVINGYVSTICTNGTNSSSEAALYSDIGSGYSLFPGTLMNMNLDHQLQDDRASASFSITTNVSVGQKFKLQARRVTGTATMTTAASSGLNIFNPGTQGLAGPTGANGPTGPAALTDLTDVSISGLPGEGTQSLVYNPSTSKWSNRELCNPIGEITALGNGSTGSLFLNTVNTWYQIGSGATTGGTTGYFLNTNDSQFPSASWQQPSAGRIQYILDTASFAHCAYSFSAAVSNSTDQYQVSIFQNGVQIPGTISACDFNVANVTVSFAYHKVVTLSQNDIFDIRIRDITNNFRTITFNNVNLVLMDCCPRGF